MSSTVFSNRSIGPNFSKNDLVCATYGIFGGEAGADLLTFHIEAVADPVPLIEEIRKLGAGVGISLNPPTPVETLEPYLDRCDLFLPMSVMPGFGGQKFDPVALAGLVFLLAVGIFLPMWDLAKVAV